jgi:tRNA A-37 threonylcarbamoyl transferase component Bud32
MDDIVLDRLIGDIADGIEPDWEAAIRTARSPEDRERVEDLRVLHMIACAGRPGLPAASDASTAPADASAPAYVDRVPTRWGRYLVKEKIGEGSFGAVYRAWDPHLEYELAIKIPHPGPAGDEYRERLRLEGARMAQIRHPHVVKVIALEHEAGEPALAMELVRGETLDDVVQRTGVLSAREAALVGEDVAGALAAVHDAKIVHRDVKARNVMREQGGRIVLMDFGAGQRVDGSERFERNEGTPLYMAPEVLAGARASECSDVYGIGILLYHLVTGDYPVVASSVEELRSLHMQGRRRSLAQRRPDLPTAFRQTVERATAPNPDERYASAAALLTSLEAFRTTSRQQQLLARYFVYPAAALLATMTALTVLGVISTRFYNYAFRRQGFAEENPWDWLAVGGMASLYPVTMLLAAVLLVCVLCALWQVVAAAVPTLHQVGARLAAAGRRLGHAVGLQHLPVLSSYVTLCSAAALALAWWRFSPLLGAVFSDMTTEQASVLARLSTDHCLEHEKYLLSLTGVLGFALVAWTYAFRRAAVRGERVNRVHLAGGAAVLLFTVLSIYFPWKTVWGNEVEAVSWQGVSCHVMGERDGEALLYCPTLPDRNRVVMESELGPRGNKEHIFWQFAAGPVRARHCTN